MKYGGGSKGEAETLASGAAQVLQAELERTKQVNEQAQASGQNIQQGMSVLVHQKQLQEAQAHQTAMQAAEIKGRSELSAQEAQQQQEAQGHAAYLRGEAEPTGAASTAPGQAGAAAGTQGPPTPPPQNLPGQVSTTRGSGAYAPTQATKEGAYQRSQLVGSEVYGNMAKVEANKKITEAHLKQMDLETGIKRDEFERRAYDSQARTNEHLFGVEASAAEHIAFIDTKANPEKAKELMQVAREARGRREAEGLMYAARTGDTSFMIPDSESQKQMQPYLTRARMMLNASPAMQDIARRRGAVYAGKAVNRFAAQLQLYAMQNPDMQQASAMAFIQEEQTKMGGAGGGPGSTTQPGR